MKIYCCECDDEKSRRLIEGYRLYPLNRNVSDLYFYLCRCCGNKVGCHKGTKRPMGVIPTKEISNARQKIHMILDPIWKVMGEQRKEFYRSLNRISDADLKKETKKEMKIKQSIKRKNVYKYLSEKLGFEYHTAEIRCIHEARKVYSIILEYKRDFTGQ